VNLSQPVTIGQLQAATAVSGPARCHAWVDESIHTPDERTATGLYVVAAAIGDADGVEPTREVLRSLVPRRQVRLHWRDEEKGGPRRRKILDAIAASDVANVVVVGAPLDPRNQERARRKCLERLLWELCENWEVATVWLESRTSSLNRKDMKLVDALRGGGTLGPGTRVEFGLPSQEPMLWIPDAVAGCVADARKGDASDLDTVADMVEQIDVTT
jgi:hypothetical protein